MCDALKTASVLARLVCSETASRPRLPREEERPLPLLLQRQLAERLLAESGPRATAGAGASGASTAVPSAEGGVGSTGAGAARVPDASSESDLSSADDDVLEPLGRRSVLGAGGEVDELAAPARPSRAAAGVAAFSLPCMTGAMPEVCQTFFDVVPWDSARGPAILPARSVSKGDAAPHHDGRDALSFSELRQFLLTGAALPRELLSRNERLCSALPNGPEALTAFLFFSLRCTYAPLNLDLSAPDFEFELEDLPCKVLVVGHPDDLNARDKAQTEKLLGVAARSPSVSRVLVLRRSSRQCGIFGLAERLAGGAEAALEQPNSERERMVREGTKSDVALVLHTSGTTSKPKCVPLSHLNMGAGAASIRNTLSLKSGEDVCLNAMPLFHIHGLSVNVLQSLVAGCSVVCAPGKFDASVFWDLAGGCTWYSAVPTMHAQILAEFKRHKNSITKHVKPGFKFARNCSAALVPSVASEMCQVMGVDVVPTYAMTESMPICSNPRAASARECAGEARHGELKQSRGAFEARYKDLRSVGPGQGPEVRILAMNEKEFASFGEEGEIVVRGPCVTAGYEMRDHMSKDPNTDAFFVDASDGGHPLGSRWLRTGDKGWMDANGYVSLSGRFKEIINRAGEKISPFEIEERVRTATSRDVLKDVICFAAPHDSLGEVVGLCVVLGDEGEATPKLAKLSKLRSACGKAGMAAIWLPEIVVYVDAIPKGPTGKPARIGFAKKALLQPLTGDGEDPSEVDFRGKTLA